VTSSQLKQARTFGDIVCVQNQYNLFHREDDALVDECENLGVAYVPFFPLGGLTPLQSSTLSEIAEELGATPMQTALAWLLRRGPPHSTHPGHDVGRPSA
jgi:aryl-alcohol dehydrogenase-like predicted oxidoreductase